MINVEIIKNCSKEFIKMAQQPDPESEIVHPADWHLGLEDIEIQKLIDVAIEDGNSKLAILISERLFSYPLVKQQSQQLLEVLLRRDLDHRSWGYLSPLLVFSKNFSGLFNPSKIEKAILDFGNEIEINRYFNNVPGANINNYLDKIENLIERNINLRNFSSYGFKQFIRTITSINGIDLQRLDQFMVQFVPHDILLYLEARDYDINVDLFLEKFLKANNEQLLAFVEKVQKYREIDLVPIIFERLKFSKETMTSLNDIISNLCQVDYKFSDQIIDELIKLEYPRIYLVTGLGKILEKCLSFNKIKYASEIINSYIRDSDATRDGVPLNILNLMTKIVVLEKDPFLAKTFLEAFYENPNFNFLAIQTIIEKYGPANLLINIGDQEDQFRHVLEKFNFGSFKRKYNEKYEVYLKNSSQDKDTYATQKKEQAITYPPLKRVETRK